MLIKNMSIESTDSTTYTIYEYNTGVPVGKIVLTNKQFSRYSLLSQQPEGLVELSTIIKKLEWVSIDITINPENNPTVYLD